MEVWRGAWQVKPGWFVLIRVKVYRYQWGLSHGKRMWFCWYPTLSHSQEGSRTPKLWFLNRFEGSWGSSVQPNGRYFFLAWLDGYFFSLCGQRLVYTVVWEKWSEPGLVSRFLQTPQKLGGSQEITQRDGQVSSLRSSVRLTWSGLGSICGENKCKKFETLLVKWEKRHKPGLCFCVAATARPRLRPYAVI